jgi:DHA3 family macrolide efflux protein-like MFS transporter
VRANQWWVRFFSIWTGQQLSLVGSALGGFALVWWLTIITGSAQVLATATIALIVPKVLLWPVVGAYVDRWERRKIILLADTWTALASLALAILFWIGAMEVWHVYVVILARAIGGAFHQPAFYAVTPLLVPERHLARVAGLGNVMEGTMSVAGPLLGALMISILPIHGVMLIDVGTALFAVIPLLLFAIPVVEKSATEPRRTWQSIREGLAYVRSVRGLVPFIAAFAFLNLVANPAYRFLPLLVTQHFEAGAISYASLSSAWGIGVIVAGLVVSVWGGFRRKMCTIVLGTAIQGLGTLLVGLSPAWAIALAVGGMGIAGFGNSATNAPVRALFQGGVPNKLQGRFFTIFGMIMMGAQPIGFAVAGPLVEVIGIRTWLVAVGILQAAVVLGLLLLPSVRQLEEAFAQVKGKHETDAAKYSKHAAT